MMVIISISEAKSKLSRLVDAVQHGNEKEIVITRNGGPVARLVPVQQSPAGQRIGIAKGKFKVPDDIDEANPLIQKLFEGREE